MEKQNDEGLALAFVVFLLSSTALGLYGHFTVGGIGLNWPAWLVCTLPFVRFCWWLLESPYSTKVVTGSMSVFYALIFGGWLCITGSGLLGIAHELGVWVMALLLEPSGLSRTFVAGMVILTGTLMFLLRIRMRACYDFSEALVGVCIATSRTPHGVRDLSDAQVLLALLTAGVYLIVRGLDNMHQGLTKEPLDRHAIALRSSIYRTAARFRR